MTAYTTDCCHIPLSNLENRFTLAEVIAKHPVSCFWTHSVVQLSCWWTDKTNIVKNQAQSLTIVCQQSIDQLIK